MKGTVRPGSYAGASSGVINFGTKNVTFNEGSQLVIGASRCATASANGCAAIDGIGTLTMNGTIQIVPTNGHRLAIGDSIRIFKADEFIGMPTFDMQGGVEWDTSRISEGLLFVKAIDLSVSDVRRSAIDPKAVYDLRGRMVRTADQSLEGLPSGIYIRGGKKIVVK